MRPKSYVILDRAVEEGIAQGWNRAHKHTDNPAHDHIKETIRDAVLSAISEVFSFRDDEILE